MKQFELISGTATGDGTPVILEGREDDGTKIFQACLGAAGRTSSGRWLAKRNLLGTYEVAQPLGRYSDTLHPSVEAYGAIAMDLSQYVLA